MLFIAESTIELCRANLHPELCSLEHMMKIGYPAERESVGTSGGGEGEGGVTIFAQGVIYLRYITKLVLLKYTINFQLECFDIDSFINNNFYY